MKRILFNLSVALLTFCAGVGGELGFRKYLEFTSPKVITYRHELTHFALALPQQEGKAQLQPGSLPTELQRIDELYRKRCKMPTDWAGQWPTIKQMNRFSVCNDEWAKTRRQAIRAELSNYLIRY